MKLMGTQAASALLTGLCLCAAWGAAVDFPAPADSALPAPLDEDLARRTFANAEQLMREGKIEQALRDFEQVSSAYPESGMADDALYRIAQHYYPAQTVDALGGASEDAIAKAKDLFVRINTRYPREDAAPKALYKLGLIALDPANPKRNTDEAYASFAGVMNIYPASDVVDSAIFGAGFSDFLAGKYDKSIAAFERVAEEYPRGAVAEEARFYMALAYARQESYIRALEEFQAVRDLQPEGKMAARALDRLSQIYKMKVQPGLAGRPRFTHDPTYAPALDPAAPRGDIALAVGADSVAHMLDIRSGELLRLGHDGKVRSTGTPFPGWAISVDRAAMELIAAGDRIRAGVEVIIPQRQEGSTLRPFQKITAAVRVGLRDIALLDEDRSEVLLYRGDPAKLKLLYRDPAGRARLTGLAAGAEGKLYTIDKRGRKIMEISTDTTSREISAGSGPEQVLQEPAALAADDLGNLFVLDRRTDAVVIMTVEGKVLEKIASQPGTPAEFSYPSAIAVGPRAEIYVYDTKRKTILRFR